MLSRSVDILDLDGGHLAGWLELLLPPGLARSRWAALFLAADGSVAHAVQSERGAIDAAGFTGTSPRQLAAFRRALGTGLVVVFADGGPGRLLGEIERSLRFEDDYPAQCVTALRAFKRMSGDCLWLDPPLADIIPPLAPDTLQRAFELLVPGPAALTAYVFDGGEILASVIAVVEAGDITLITTHLGIEDALPGRTLARGWRTGHRRALELIAERYAAPSIGLFADRAAWNRIITGPSDQLAREIAAGHIVIDPAPAWLRGLLGAAQLGAMATGAARQLARFVPPAARRAASGVAGAAQRRLEQSGAHPFALLGFDPIALWHQVRRYYRPTSGP
jgi:hypothetical protein